MQAPDYKRLLEQPVILNERPVQYGWELEGRDLRILRWYRPAAMTLVGAARYEEDAALGEALGPHPDLLDEDEWLGWSQELRVAYTRRYLRKAAPEDAPDDDSLAIDWTLLRKTRNAPNSASEELDEDLGSTWEVRCITPFSTLAKVVADVAIIRLDFPVTDPQRNSHYGFHYWVSLDKDYVEQRVDVQETLATYLANEHEYLQLLGLVKDMGSVLELAAMRELERHEQVEDKQWFEATMLKLLHSLTPFWTPGAFRMLDYEELVQDAVSYRKQVKFVPIALRMMITNSDGQQLPFLGDNRLALEYRRTLSENEFAHHVIPLLIALQNPEQSVALHGALRGESLQQGLNYERASLSLLDGLDDEVQSHLKTAAREAQERLNISGWEAYYTADTYLASAVLPLIPWEERSSAESLKEPLRQARATYVAALQALPASCGGASAAQLEEVTLALYRWVGDVTARDFNLLEHIW